MLDAVYSQSDLPFSYSIAVPSAHEAPAARLVRIFQRRALSKKSANDNKLAWPFIPFPEGWHAA
jgi:hypothetical protein